MQRTDAEVSPKVDESVRQDRRRFCAGLAVLGASACTGPTDQIAVGQLDGALVGGPDDFASSTPSDLAGNPNDFATSGTHDLATGSSKDMATDSSSCAAGTSGGAASAIVEGTPKYISSITVYVCRDAGGLYAMSSKCTHQQCKLTPQATQFYCNCHGATFDLNGGSPTSPAHSALTHYAVCVDASGNVQVDKSQTVSATTRA